MGGINWTRVVLGGAVAGLVIGTVQAFLIPLRADAFGAAVAAMGGPSAGFASEPTPAFMLAGTLVICAVGIFTIWLYASIRPRYGAGIRTAAIAGVGVWAAIALAELLLSLLTNLTIGHIAATHGPNIVTFAVAAIAGAWVYREEAPASAVAAPAA